MSLVGENDVFNGHAVLLNRSDHFIRFDFKHTRVVRTLEDDCGFLDLVCMEQRRFCPQEVLLLERVSELFIKSLPERLPPRRNTLQCPHPIRDAEDIHAHIELVWPECQRSADHVAPIAPPDDADLVRVDNAG